MTDCIGAADPYGIPAALLARACGVDLSTARKWKRRGLIPPRYFHLVRLALGGELGVIAPAWSGWSLRAGQLISPEGVEISPGEVRAIPYRAHQVAELERQLRELQQQKPSGTVEPGRSLRAAPGRCSTRAIRPAGRV